MATDDHVSRLRKAAEAVTDSPIEALISNPAWGSLNFRDAEKHLGLIAQLGGYLRSLPVELVPDSAMNQFISALEEALQTINEIRNFSIENTSNPKQRRDEIVKNLRLRAENLLSQTQGWIAFLAYQQGDVQRNIDALNDAVRRANVITDESRQHANDQMKEVEGIVAATREAAAKAGVAHFTHAFFEKAKDFGKEANRWLWATGIFAVLTVVFSLLSTFLFQIPAEAGRAQAIQLLSSKLFVFVVLLTGTIWCGRLFRATKHQAAISMHRASALTTFQAFVKAAGDEPTKNAVLMETTRSIFAISPSGYLETTESPNDNGLRVLEVVKGIGADRTSS